MRVRFLIVLCFILSVTAAFPNQDHRIKRSVMDAVKNAWHDVVKTFNDAGDAVVHVFKPTERSVLDKVADGIKGITK